MSVMNEPDQFSPSVFNLLVNPDVAVNAAASLAGKSSNSWSASPDTLPRFRERTPMPDPSRSFGQTEQHFAKLYEGREQTIPPLRKATSFILPPPLPEGPAAQHSRQLPLTDVYLIQLLKWHKEKEGSYPNSKSKTPVWAKDEKGAWYKADESWISITSSIRAEARDVETEASGLTDFMDIHKLSDRPMLTREMLIDFLDSHRKLMGYDAHQGTPGPITDEHGTPNSYGFTWGMVDELLRTGRCHASIHETSLGEFKKTNEYNLRKVRSDKKICEPAP